MKNMKDSMSKPSDKFFEARQKNVKNEFLTNTADRIKNMDCEELKLKESEELSPDDFE